MKINLGLNNNPWTYEQVVDFFKMYNLKSERKDMGEWQDNPEPTAVLVIDNVDDAEVEKWCQYFTQECIAVLRDDMSDKYGSLWDWETGEGSLIYNPDYTGERYTFDFKYFIQ